MRPGLANKGVFNSCPALIALLLLSGCAQLQPAGPGLSSIDPLLLSGDELTALSAAASVPTPDLLGMTAEMRDFADRYVKRGSQHQRLLVLHSSLKSPAMAGVSYDPSADGTAAQAFQQGRANCLSYAHLFISMARYSGLNARYRVVNLRPEWSRHGDHVALRQHVNVMIKLRDGSEFAVDIDPVPRARVASAREISDRQAFALYHANRAMGDLLLRDYASAYAQAARSLQLSGSTDYLWVNLGAIYRRTGQDDSAERSYMTALRLNPHNPSAMNNLGVLYHDQGQLVQAQEWEEKVVDHRQQNPYYHMYAGAEAELAGEPELALAHYQRAIAIKGTDADFYYQLAKLYLSMQQPAESVRYAQRAVELAQLVGDRTQYREFLRSVSARALSVR
jgi:tetratricopeptide (TPR) repeat protein